MDTQTPDTEQRDWQVTRFCCTSGQCFECKIRGTGKRARIVHADRITEAKAHEMARNWRLYDALAAPM